MAALIALVGGYIILLLEVLHLQGCIKVHLRYIAVMRTVLVCRGVTTQEEFDFFVAEAKAMSAK